MSLSFKAIEPRIVTFAIRGTTPLVHHAWSEKALKSIRLTPGDRRKLPKLARDPEGEGTAAMYLTPDGEPGVPMRSIKAAIIAAAHKDRGIERTTVRSALFVLPKNAGAVTPLQFEKMSIREDMVRVSNSSTDLRYRPMYEGWSLPITLEVEMSLLSEQNVVDLVTRAGFSIGIGDWRPEKNGEFGRFRIDETVPFTVQ